MATSATTIGRYRIVRRLGAGGMGIVYEAVDTRDDSRLALKVLLPHAAEEADGLLRFKREFRALARLRHPNILRVFDSGIEDDVPFIAMEFLEGRDLRSHLRSFAEGPARERETRRCFRQVFGALAYIHARRIVHRDLKPENILVTHDGRVKLMDFGVARLLRTPTVSSGLLGTFAYMAPEQVTTGQIDGRSDLYAIGVLLYEILTGGYPFPVEPPAAALHHHVNTPPEHPRHVNPKADMALSTLAMKLLEKDPLDRLQSAEESFVYLADEDASGGSVDARIGPGPLFVPRFVSRQNELDLLEGVAADVSAGRGRILLIEGPSGSGRTRLIEEMRLRVRRRTHVLLGTCARERGQAYGPIQAVLDSIEVIASRAPKDVMQRILGRDVALVHAVSPRLAARGGPVKTAELEAGERKIRMHKAIVGVIGRLALTKSVVWVVEDVHWADSSTLELLWDASRTLLTPRPEGAPGETVCPVSILLTRRSLTEGPDYSEPLIRKLDRVGLERVVLPPIDFAGVNEMLRTMTGVGRPRLNAVEELVELAHGIPLAVRDAIESWVEEGVLERSGGAWLFRGERLDISTERPTLEDRDTNESGQDAAVGDTGLDAHREVATESRNAPEPRTASGVAVPHENTRDDIPDVKARRAKGSDETALAKLKPLSRSARSVAERLSVLGRLLPSDIVLGVSGLEEEECLDALDELVRANVLVEDDAVDGVRFRFAQEGLREAVARAIPKARRPEVHLAIARAIEARFRSRRSELAHVLARHWRGANVPERAVPYLLRMASSAGARGDLEGASRRLAEALAIIDDAPRTQASDTRRLRIVIKEIDLLLDFGRAREALDRADPQAAAVARSPEVLGAEIALRRAAAQFALGKLDETLATLGRLAQRAPTRSLGARLLELEGRARMARGEYAQARAVLEAAQDIAERAGLPELTLLLEAKVGIAILHQGDFATAQEKLEKGLLAARERQDARAIADLLGHIGVVHSARGEVADALACFREAIELAEARGMKGELERWSGELGTLMSQMGSFEEGQDHLETALELARETGSRHAEATWRGQLGIHYALANAPERAKEELLRCLAIAREIGFARYEAWAHLYLGLLAIERREPNVTEALEHVEAGMEIAEDLDDEEIRIVGLLHLGRVARAAGEVDRSNQAAERAESLAERSQNLRLRSRVREALDAFDEA